MGCKALPSLSLTTWVEMKRVKEYTHIHTIFARWHSRRFPTVIRLFPLIDISQDHWQLEMTKTVKELGSCYLVLFIPDTIILMHCDLLDLHWCRSYYVEFNQVAMANSDGSKL